MPNETEKLTVNLGVVELAQIDVLVEQGIYSNRSDFIRTSIRKNLETYSERIENQLTTISTKKEWIKTIGIFTITKKDLESLLEENEKININVIGMLLIDKSVSLKLFEEVVGDIIIRGKVVASNEIKERIEKKN